MKRTDAMDDKRVKEVFKICEELESGELDDIVLIAEDTVFDICELTVFVHKSDVRKLIFRLRENLCKFHSAKAFHIKTPTNLYMVGEMLTSDFAEIVPGSSRGVAIDMEAIVDSIYSKYAHAIQQASADRNKPVSNEIH